jgi:hypothetical protein
MELTMSNNKQSMKLYTRDQMIEAFNYGQKLEKFDWIGDMIDSLEARELPTDEEIHEISKDVIIYNDTKRGWFIEGLKFMRDKIQGGINE